MVKQALNGRASKYPLSAQTVPMEVALANKQDPAAQWPGAPPNWGQPDMPHIFSFVGRYGMIANAYSASDEALMHNAANAEIMRNEPMIMECIEARMRCVALLNWHIQPVDNDVLRDALDKTDSQETAMAIRKALKKPKSDAEKIADKLTSILRHTPHFMKMRYSLMDAIWYGKTATCQTMGVRNIGGQRRIFVRKWEPRHGDKLIFRYADESYEYDPEQVGIRIGPTTHGHDDTWVDYAGFERKRIDPTQHGLVYWFDGQQRRRMCIHRHIVEDGDFMRPEKAGSIQGIGIRSRIYWTWWAYQECLKLLLEYVERSALGIEIWKYPAHDPKAKERTEKAAQERGAPGRSVVLVPVPTGEYGDMYGVQIVEPGLGGINELQNVLQEFFGHKIKRYILGQVLTSEAAATGMGSGVADAHLATFHDIVRFDGLNLEETITTDLLRPLQQWNFPGTDDIFLRFVIDTESPDAQERIGSYQAAWSMGLKIRTEDMYDALGAAPPAEGEEFLSNPGMEGAMLANEAQKMQMAQMEAQMQAQPAMFAPFPEMGGGGVPGDGDGDGLANDEQAQQFQSRAKVDRYTLKKNGVGTERYSQEPIIQNLKDEHHGDLGNALKEAEKKQGIPFHSPSFYAKRGLDLNQELTNDDQHLILFHAGYLDHPEVSKKLFGDNYNSSNGSQVPSQPLGKFMVSAGRALREHGVEAKRANALNRIGGARVVSFKNQSGGRLVLHPAVRKDATSGWQLTSMSGHDGRPNGHYNPKSFDHGWQNALGVGEDGYWNERGYEVEWTDKDGTKAPFSASGDYWLEVERFGRVKPMKGQGAFNWDEEQHPRESEEHDGKRPGEFAPKEQAEAPVQPEPKPTPGGKDKDGWQLVQTEFGDTLKIKRAADFSTYGSHDVEYNGRRGQIFRDPENGYWYVQGKGHFSDNFIATSKADAISYVANEERRWMDNSKPVEAGAEHKPDVDPEQQKLLDEARAARKWTNNGDGTYTDSHGTVWRKAKEGGEISPVTGKPFKGGWLMPIHGLAAPKPKIEPKPKSTGDNSVVPNEESKRDWKAPKVRQLSEREIQEREEQRRWDAVRPELEKVFWMGDKAGYASGDIQKRILPYLKTLKPDEVQALGQQLRAKWIEREMNKYFKPDQNETKWRDEVVTRGEAAKRIAETFDDYANRNADYFIPKKWRKAFPGIEQAVQGLKSYHDDRYFDVERAEELAAILPKPGTADRLSAEDWAEIERYARLKPMAGQSSFDWDESEHPRETEAHDDKKAGEFAPKSSQDGIKVPARLASPTRKGEITEDQAKTMKVRGTTEDVTECDYCGKHSLKKTVVFELTDADGNGNGEFRHLGVDCAARLTGRKPERIAREAAERDYEAKRKQEMHDRDKPKRISDNLDDANKAFNQTGRHRGVHEIAGLTELRWNDTGKVVRVDTTDPDDVAWYEKNGFAKREQSSSHIPVHPDILDEWRSSERWAYDNAEDWAHANDADPADFDKWVKLRDKVQSVSEAVPPELQFHLWDWLNEQADGDIPSGWKQAEKQLGAQLGIYRPWTEDDGKAVEFTARGRRAAKPLFKLGGQSFALDDKRLQELQTQRYGQMFFDFDKPAKQPAQEPQKSTEVPAPEPPANSFAAKFKRYLDLQQDAAKRGLKQPRTNLLK